MNTARQRRRSTVSFRPHLEALEDRAVPAVSFSLTGSTLSITGDFRTDNVTFEEYAHVPGYYGTSHLIVTWRDDLDNRGGAYFYLPALSKIVFTGNGGHDFLYNSTNPDGLALIANPYLGIQPTPLQPLFATVPSMMPGVEAYGGSGNDYLRPGSCRDSVLEGGSGANSLYGGAGNDVLRGGAERDYLQGNAGNDRLYAGAGDDNLYGNDGNDSLYGNEGADRLYGGAGNDYLDAGANNDYLYGNEGIDWLCGEGGNDYLYGGADNDRLWGHSGNDRMYGQGGNDALYGGDGYDRLYGGRDDDGLYGGTGYDRLYGESGDDRFLQGPDDSDLFGDLDAVNDARVLFRNNPAVTNMAFSGRNPASRWDFAAGAWTDAGIQLVDQALANLQQATGNTRLLKRADDPLGLDPITYCMQGAGVQVAGAPDVPIGGWNADGDVVFVVNASERTVYHEIGHNWDEMAELSSARYLDWLDLSGWVSRSRSPGAAYFASPPAGDNWFALNSAEFARDYGRFNPQEDMATTFEAYFSRHQGEAVQGNGTAVGAAGTADIDLVPTKRDFLDALFTSLS